MADITHSGLNVSDKIQIALTAITLLAVLVALFADRIWKWFDRPRVSIEFIKSSERCLRLAIAYLDDVPGEMGPTQVARYYFRLKVDNAGGTVQNLRVRADILGMDKEPLEYFEPVTLNWIVGKESIDLAKGESEYINLASQVVSYPNQITNRLTVEVSNTDLRGISWDRPLSEYFLEVTAYGDNIRKPVQNTFKFTPDNDLTKPGSLTDATNEVDRRGAWILPN
ncbi:MAG TPA: hypothetical protein VLF40_00570 [Candidatus Saccharimonadales bacterium]|nr:hypothetical protein [Candidatus Saccharimonadales bacterium]